MKVVKAIKANKRKKAKAIVKKKRAKKVQAELVKATAPLAAASADPDAWDFDGTPIHFDKPWVPDSVDIDGKKSDNDTPITFWQAVREMFGFKFK
jgi:hypothetical protein